MSQLQWWENLVQVTGGELNPTKCCGLLYHWAPDKHGVLRLQPPNVPTDFLHLDHPDGPQPFPITPLHEGIWYLGIYFSMNRSTKPMEAHLWKKALIYTAAFHRTSMSRCKAIVLYRSCFLPALTYPLPAVWLPDRFFTKVHCLSTSTILNKMGFHRNLPWCLVFAPCHIGGVGLCNLQWEMEVQQILILLCHMHASTPLGNTMSVLICQYQLLAGLPNPVLSDTTPCPWIPNKWVSRIRQTLHSHNIQITYDHWDVPPLRHHDIYIMEAVQELGLTKLQLEQINACCMHLRVTTFPKLSTTLEPCYYPRRSFLPTVTIQWGCTRSALRH